MCNLEKSRKCEHVTICFQCGRRLCHQAEDHCKVEGHFAKDTKAYCIKCWYEGLHKETGKTEPVSVNIDKP